MIWLVEKGRDEFDNYREWRSYCKRRYVQRCNWEFRERQKLITK